MKYDYLKHTLRHVGKTCKHLKEYFNIANTDITVGYVISIKIEVYSDLLQYKRTRCIEISYKEMNMTNYLRDLKILLKVIEVELIEENYKLWKTRYEKERKHYGKDTLH